MTCIAAIKQNGNVYLASDSEVSWGNSKGDFGSKLAKTGELIIGTAGDSMTGDLIREVFSAPTRGSKDAYKYLISEYGPALRNFLKTHEVLTIKDGTARSKFWAVVALDRRLFTIFSNFAVIEHEEYAAFGSGEEFAIGSLYSTSNLPVRERLTLAVSSAIKHAQGCGGDIHFMSTED